MFDNSIEIYNKIENYSLEHKQVIPKVKVKDYEKSNFRAMGIDKEYPILNSILKY